MPRYQPLYGFRMLPACHQHQSDSAVEGTKHFILPDSTLLPDKTKNGRNPETGKVDAGRQAIRNHTTQIARYSAPVIWAMA